MHRYSHLLLQFLCMISARATTLYTYQVRNSNAANVMATIIPYYSNYNADCQPLSGILKPQEHQECRLFSNTPTDHTSYAVLFYLICAAQDTVVYYSSLGQNYPACLVSSTPTTYTAYNGTVVGTVLSMDAAQLPTLTVFRNDSGPVEVLQNNNIFSITTPLRNAFPTFTFPRADLDNVYVILKNSSPDMQWVWIYPMIYNAYSAGSACIDFKTGAVGTYGVCAQIIPPQGEQKLTLPWPGQSAANAYFTICYLQCLAEQAVQYYNKYPDQPDQWYPACVVGTTDTDYMLDASTNVCITLNAQHSVVTTFTVATFAPAYPDSIIQGSQMEEPLNYYSFLLQQNPAAIFMLSKDAPPQDDWPAILAVLVLVGCVMSCIMTGCLWHYCFGDRRNDEEHGYSLINDTHGEPHPTNCKRIMRFFATLCEQRVASPSAPPSDEASIAVAVSDEVSSDEVSSDEVSSDEVSSDEAFIAVAVAVPPGKAP